MNEQSQESVLYHLVLDDDGHYYIISEDQDENFDQWVEDTVNGKKSKFDFESSRLGGSPTRFYFKEWIKK